MTDPKPATERAQANLISRLKARIYGLVNRGALVCSEWQTPSDQIAAQPSCGRCGYSADVHLLRDVLTLLSSPLPDTEREPEPVCDCGHGESEHDEEFGKPCRQCSCINPRYPVVLPSEERVRKLVKEWRSRSGDWLIQAAEHGADEMTVKRFRERMASLLMSCADELSAALEGKE